MKQTLKAAALPVGSFIALALIGQLFEATSNQYVQLVILYM